MVRAYAYEHLKSLLDECVTDPSTREKLFQSKGFCRRHAWQGVHQRQSLGMAVIYNSLLEKGLKELSLKPRFWKSGKAGSCLICESEKAREHSAVRNSPIAGWNQKSSAMLLLKKESSVFPIWKKHWPKKWILLNKRVSRKRVKKP